LEEFVVAPGMAIGSFLSTVINFLVIALVLYFIVKIYEQMQRASSVEEAENAEPSIEEKLNDTLERLTDFLESRSRR
jgi:large conductance mechanosensitive channel